MLNLASMGALQNEIAANIYCSWVANAVAGFAAGLESVAGLLVR